MLKAKKKKGTITSLPNRLLLARHTYQTWIHLYPKSNYDEWMCMEHPDNILEFVEQMLLSMRIKNFDFQEVGEIVLITLDDEFLKWLSDNNKQHTSQSEIEYMQQISDEDAFRLLKKNHLDHIMQGLVIPVLVYNEQPFGYSTEYYMSNDTRQYLSEYLKELYQVDVCVLPYYMQADALYNEYQDVEDIGRVYFQDGIHVKLDKYQVQHYAEADINVTSLYIPFFINEILSSATLKLPLDTDETGNVILSRVPECACFSREDIIVTDEDDFAFYYKKELNQSLVQKDIGTTCVTVCCTPVFTSDILDVEEDIYNSFNEVN